MSKNMDLEKVYAQGLDNISEDCSFTMEETKWTRKN